MGRDMKGELALLAQELKWLSISIEREDEKVYAFGPSLSNPIYSRLSYQSVSAEGSV